MAGIPKPRREGQTGGGGRHGQAGNRHRSSNRGGRPHAGGGGTGNKAGGGSSFVEDRPGLVWALMAWSMFVLVAPIVSLAGLIALVV